MSPVLFVTGTGTEVGKTLTTAAVAALCSEPVAVLKPGQTGLGPDEPGDADEVARLAGPLVRPVELARYPEPLAPETAARRAGLPPLDPADVAKAVAGLAAEHRTVLVEGAGGLLVRYDEQGHTLADFALACRLLGLDVEFLLVAAAGLGTLNATALTAEALHHRGLPLRGTVIGCWPAEPDLATRCNLADLPTAAGAPLLGALPSGAAAHTPATFRPFAAAALAPALGGRWDAAAFAAAHPA
ncbi:ATP-dependent dethiobiotin synthetase BioD [Kitasatospora phosalacinea]|uniref:ATP-dependent dethiobiotin synthetase BioD n=1 Tax=Kitasatospora phosalacinea TaxID=2065 RepID=A0A9W6Q6H3_9ACTN|nr:dethiobiotin synthase [Kitasatospora phosalacinea]GLW69671.1 ATP-dependent dethiobiotin synthetase BioD [Kitasatospora phosalacinea]